jgi:hypothetical protein
MEDRMSTEIDDAIAQYSSQLRTEAELARSDLTEIEDHLRSLIEELQGAGMPAAEAIAEAARRLGDPRQLAREHVRVRTPFGARLSRARAWSAIAAMLPALAIGLWNVGVHRGFISIFGLSAAIEVALLIAVASPLAWARAILLGILINPPALFAFHVVAGGRVSALQLAHIASLLGAVALISPWHRGELTARGWVLVMLGSAYLAAMHLLGLVAQGPLILEQACAALSAAAVLAAYIGGVLGSRWASATALVGAPIMIGSTFVLSSETQPDAALWYRAYLLGPPIIGAIALAIAALLIWRAPLAKAWRTV